MTIIKKSLATSSRGICATRRTRCSNPCPFIQQQQARWSKKIIPILLLLMLVIITHVHASAVGVTKSKSTSSFISNHHHHHHPWRNIASHNRQLSQTKSTLTTSSSAPPHSTFFPLVLNASPMSSQADDGNEAAAAVKTMNVLLESLSLEPTDEARRQRLARVFEENLANDGSKQVVFADLFQQQLVVFGNDIRAILMQQQDAKQQQQQQQEQSAPEESASASQNNSDNDETNEYPSKKQKGYMSDEKSTEEKQLWALVDMMVQSKTLVKKIMTEKK